MSAFCPVFLASLATTVGVLFAVLGGLVAVFAVYQLVLAIAAFFYRRPRSLDEPRSRLVVLVPAHDEAALIARCVGSLNAQTYPADLYELIVIADNCTDDTAAVARAAGAEVLVRDRPDERGKGRALRWAMDQIVARTPGPDGIAVVDADSVAAPDFLESLVVPLEQGAPAVQGESLLAEDGSSAAAFRAAAFLLINRVRPAGRAVLGLPCTLAGNGMLFSSELLRAHPWNAFTSAEDLEYSIELRLAGVRPVFAGGAILLSPAAPTADAAEHQQLRWEGGKLHVARSQIPRLVAAAFRLRKPSLLDAAFELAILPLGLLAAVTAAGTIVGAIAAATGLLPAWSLAPWVAGLVTIPLYVLIGLNAAHAPRSAYRALAQAPLFVLTKVRRLPRLFTFRPDTWVRTERDARRRDDR